MRSTKLMSPSVMMNLKSRRPMYEILIIKVRTMTPTIKIETKNNNNNNNSSSSPSYSGTGYNKHYNNNGGHSDNTRSNFLNKPTNVQVTLTGPVNRD